MHDCTIHNIEALRIVCNKNRYMSGTALTEDLPVYVS